jgi:hypothetical protein
MQAFPGCCPSILGLLPFSKGDPIIPFVFNYEPHFRRPRPLKCLPHPTSLSHFISVIRKSRIDELEGRPCRSAQKYWLCSRSVHASYHAFGLRGEDTLRHSGIRPLGVVHRPMPGGATDRLCAGETPSRGRFRKPRILGEQMAR